MTNEDLQKKLSLLQTKLSEAHKENDTELIHKYVAELNNLWDKASVDMLKNAESDGIYPYKPLND